MSKQVALALSSGGARGVAQIGAIRELEAHGYRISSIAGSSMGAIIGGLYAMDQLDIYADWLCTLRRSDVFSLMDFTLSRRGVMKGEKVFSKMRSMIPDMLIEDMRIPFTAVSADILLQQEAIFAKGSFYEAARASIAIPGVFTPVAYEEHQLVDGAILNPLPINHVRRNPGDILAVINVNGPDDAALVAGMGATRLKGYVSIFQQTMNAMLGRIASLSIELYRPDIVINIPQNISGPWEYHRADYLIERGRETARQAIMRYEQDPSAHVSEQALP